MQIENLIYSRQDSVPEISAYVKWFWTVENVGNDHRHTDILPDGYFDLLFVSIDGAPFKVSLVGLATRAASFVIPANSKTLAISFKPFAAEYIFKRTIHTLLDRWTYLYPGFLANTLNIERFSSICKIRLGLH